MSANRVVFTVETKGDETGWAMVHQSDDRELALARARAENRAPVKVTALDMETYRSDVIYRAPGVKRVRA